MEHENEIKIEGKTKIIKKLEGHKVEIISKDDITAEDGAKRDLIENKAILANNTTCNVFELLEKSGIVTHFIRRGAENSFIALDCEMCPVEVVIRRVAVGSYLKRNPNTKKGMIFETPEIEFFYKDDELNDPYIETYGSGALENRKEWELYVAKQPIDCGGYIKTIKSLWSQYKAKKVRDQARDIFLILEKAFDSIGITLKDMKIEFGLPLTSAADDLPILADVIDNDSWRIETKEGEQLDKQLYRDGEKLDIVKDKYEVVSKLTNEFPKMEIKL